MATVNSTHDVKHGSDLFANTMNVVNWDNVGIWDKLYENLGKIQCNIFFLISYEASNGDEFYVKPDL